jgi:hypothetical protein
MMILGHQDAPPNPKEVRDLDKIIHYNDRRIKDFRTDEQVIADVQNTCYMEFRLDP